MENPAEIPIIYEGTEKWITGLTPKTTCDDVIHSVLINVGCPVAHDVVRDYALFENWRGVERALRGRSRFLKLWRDWGEERSHVEVTMRKVDSAVKDDVLYGTMRRKNRIKDWFKSKDKKKSVSKSLHNIYQDVAPARSNLPPVHNPDDSSILAQGKDNMFCAFSCYKRKARGLRERNTNIKTPFEKPRSVAVVASRGTVPASVQAINNIYEDTYNCQAKKQQSQIYGSKTSLKQTYVSKRRSCHVEKYDDEPIYATARDPVCDIEKYYDAPARRRLPQNVHDWDYDAIDADTAESGSEGSGEGYNDARFKSLLSLVLKQERTIQEQVARLQRADRQIERYELAMHEVRASQQGTDYVQHTYLPLAAVESDSRPNQQLGSIREKVTEMDDQLRLQYEKLRDLSMQLEAETKQLEESIRIDHRDMTANTTQAEGPFESTRLSPKPENNQSELLSHISALRNHLQKSLSTTAAHQQDIQNIDLDLHQYEDEMQSKQEQLQKLLSELSLSSYEKSLLSNSDMGLNENNPAVVPQPEVVDSMAPRALTRQLKSLSDLQISAPESGLQPRMRKSVSDVRGSSQSAGDGSVFDKHLRLCQEMKNMEDAMRSLLTPRGRHSKTSRDATENYTEMGIDVGGLVSAKTSPNHNKTDDVKRGRNDVTLRRTHLTPIKEQDASQAMLEYHNETVDLDAFCKTGRFQKSEISTVANARDSQNDIVELIYDSSVALTRDDDIAENDVSNLLPPLGLETMTTFKSRRLMPALNDTTRESFDVTESINVPLAPEENTSVWGTPSSTDTQNEASCVVNSTQAQDNTSIWNTQEIVDGTFTVAQSNSAVQPEATSPNAENSQVGELTLCGVSIATEDSVSSAALVCPGTDALIRQTIARSVMGESPEGLCSVKKRLFPEENPIVNEGDSLAKMADITIPEITKLEGSLSPLSTVSESCESGVGSMPSDELTDSAMSWGSSFSETTV